MASARAYKLPDTKYKFAPLEYDHSAIDDDKAKAAVGWLVKGLHTLQQSPMASAIFVGLVTEKEIDPAVQVHAYRTAPSGVAQESYALDTDWETQFEKGMLSSDTSDTEDDEDDETTAAASTGSARSPPRRVTRSRRRAILASGSTTTDAENKDSTPTGGGGSDDNAADGSDASPSLTHVALPVEETSLRKYNDNNEIGRAHV